MADQIYKNNFEVALMTAAAPADTILALPSAATSKLGTLTGGDWITLTICKRVLAVESDIEIVKCTNVDPNGGGNCLVTVVRAQEGTTAKTYDAGDFVSVRITAGGMDNAATNAELATHAGNTSNPHTVTKAQVGLGNADNTSDMNKPVSTAQAAALALKVNAADKDASGGFAGLTGFKINMRNTANTWTSWLLNAATAVRTWTFPDKDGTVAMTSDITGTNSGVNTGDETVTTIRAKLGITTLSGSNTGDETGASIRTALGVTTLSGSNTGDEDAASIRSKLGVATLSGSNTGDQTSVSGSSGSCTGNAATATRLAGTPTWNLVEIAGVLHIQVSGVSKAKLDASGNLTVIGNVTAYGTM